MRQLLILTTIFILMFTGVWANDGLPQGNNNFVSGLEITGFLDVLGSYNKSSDDKSDYSLGQAEIDLEKQFSENTVVALAVAYNSDESIFELGAAEIGFTVYENDVSFVNNFEVVAGQFDVPFGIDLNVYPSIERKLVSSPLVCDYTHAGWNDYGFKLNLSSTYWNMSIFGVNGFESSFEVSDAAQSLALGVDIGEEVNTTPANAFGSRLGVSPIQNMEIGGSFAIGLNKDGEDEMFLVGGDMQYSTGQFELKGEYIQHSLNRSINEEVNKGYYVQSVVNFENTFLVGRYGAFQPDGLEWFDRVTLGAGYVINEDAQLRFESTINENSDDNSNTIQVVVGF